MTAADQLAHALVLKHRASLWDEGTLVLAAHFDPNLSSSAGIGDQIARLSREYPARAARGSLAPVARLREQVAPATAVPAVGVVGTNGKSSTATYLARLLSASGRRTGLYVSPHLSDWTERIRIDDAPTDPDLLLKALTTVHEAARAGGELADLRFFDVLTLTAERLIGAAGAEVAVFEAGIGGRLDATRLLEPQVVLLTSIGVDHAEILGEEPEQILEEKLLVAPPGATVLSFSLGGELDELAGEIAAEHEFQIVWVDPDAGEPLDAPVYLRSALQLAGEARWAIEGLLPASSAGNEPGPAHIDLALPGRFERGERGETPYVLDAAHNEDAWRLLAFELRRQFGDPPEAPPYVALVSVSPAKRRDDLADVLASIPGLASVIATRHTALPAEDPRRLAEELAPAGLDASAIEDVDKAAAAAFERAAAADARVLVFGSTHLVGDLRRWLGDSGG